MVRPRLCHLLQQSVDILCRVASLILASDKAAKRVKQIERFVELAKLLRTQHNYSGLRCVLNGINMAKIEGDEVSEIFMSRSRAVYKVYMSYNTLLSSSKMHRAYRTALKHIDGPAIPDMYVPHLSRSLHRQRPAQSMAHVTLLDILARSRFATGSLLTLICVVQGDPHV